MTQFTNADILKSLDIWKHIARAPEEHRKKLLSLSCLGVEVTKGESLNIVGSAESQDVLDFVKQTLESVTFNFTSPDLNFSFIVFARQVYPILNYISRIRDVDLDLPSDFENIIKATAEGLIRKEVIKYIHYFSNCIPHLLACKSRFDAAIY